MAWPINSHGIVEFALSPDGWVNREVLKNLLYVILLSFKTLNGLRRLILFSHWNCKWQQAGCIIAARNRLSRVSDDFAPTDKARVAVAWLGPRVRCHNLRVMLHSLHSDAQCTYWKWHLHIVLCWGQASNFISTTTIIIRAVTYENL